MVIFHSYVKLPEGNRIIKQWVSMVSGQIHLYIYISSIFKEGHESHHIIKQKTFLILLGYVHSIDSGRIVHTFFEWTHRPWWFMDSLPKLQSGIHPAQKGISIRTWTRCKTLIVGAWSWEAICKCRKWTKKNRGITRRNGASNGNINCTWVKKMGKT